MNNSELEQICCKTVAAAKDAGAFIKSELGKVQLDQIQEKEKHSLVSYVDIETEKRLIRSLQPLVNPCQFITEEGTYSKSVVADYSWVIDPLDGTTNFLKGIPVFSVSIALCYKMEPILGVVYDIMHDDCYYAWEGGGAYCNGKNLQVSDVPQLDEAIIATGFPYKRGWMPDLSELLTRVLHHSRGIRRLGSAAIDLAFTSAGKFDGYYESRLNSWDIAAGILLIKEAGGKVTDLRGNSSGILNSHHILASNGMIHEELLMLVSDLNLEDSGKLVE